MYEWAPLHDAKRCQDKETSKTLADAGAKWQTVSKKSSSVNVVVEIIGSAFTL